MDIDRSDAHFEEVLGRLDSLIRHGQESPAPLPPPSVSEATIPVLTEVYAPEPAESMGPETTPRETVISSSNVPEADSERLEMAVAAVLPLMVEVLEKALVMKVQPALESALAQILEDLKPEVEDLLRRQLQAKLAQEDQSNPDPQTET